MNGKRISCKSNSIRTSQTRTGTVTYKAIKERDSNHDSSENSVDQAREWTPKGVHIDYTLYRNKVYLRKSFKSKGASNKSELDLATFKRSAPPVENKTASCP